MRIISHRGFWHISAEKNSVIAFDRTLALGFGTETDVRDHNGQLVVSHDPPLGDEPSWAEVVHRFEGTGLPLAVNVKSDGLAIRIKESFEGRNLEWFAFDMSGPETIRYHRADIPFYSRHSDIEHTPILYAYAAGIWLDAFDTEWFDAATISAHLGAGKAVCIVSSELHGRDPHRLWAKLRAFIGAPGVTLCTDKPIEATQALRK